MSRMNKKTVELINKYPYFVGYLHGRGIFDFSEMYTCDYFEDIEAFAELGIEIEYAQFLKELGVIKRELIEDAMDYVGSNEKAFFDKLLELYIGEIDGDLIFRALEYDIDSKTLIRMANRCSTNITYDNIINALDYDMPMAGIKAMLDKCSSLPTKEQLKTLASYDEDIVVLLSPLIRRMPEEDRRWFE